MKPYKERVKKNVKCIHDTYLKMIFFQRGYTSMYNNAYVCFNDAQMLPQPCTNIEKAIYLIA